MDQATLRQELLELILLLQQLNPLQVKDLCGFLGTDPADNWFIALGIFLERCTVDQIDALLSLVTSPDLDTVQQEELRKRLQPQASEANITEKEVEDGFSLLLQLYYLQNLLVNLSILQLMKLFEVIPQGSQIQQQQILSQVQTLFAKLQPEALLNLHRQVEQAQPGTEQQTLVTLLNLPLDHFQLYQPLRVILQLDIDELLKLQEVLPKLQGTQIKQLVQLLQLTAYEVIEYRQMLNPYENALNDVELLSLTAPSVSPSINVEVPPPAPPVEKRYWLQIVEQPPEKSVYKRNLKPNPMVMVQGDAKLIPNLYVAVVLLRCDTFTEEAKFITGNRPEKVTSGRVVTFRKLKVTTTSHQQQETLFCLKFELRKYSSENEFELLDFIHSNPVCVLSHSTQMKPVPTAAPVITEVIPSCGPPSGGTRVAILGSNFVESPAARIKFDQTDVMPIFHGPGTLICHTPQHQPGMVTVRVCNSNKKWSDTSASFTYDQSLESLRDSLQEGILARQNYELNEPGSLTQASWGGGFDSVRRIQETGVNLNTIDTRGYTALHYACARANSQITSFLLDHGAVPDVQDKRGFTALFWAIAAECEESVQSLIDQGSDLNIQNFDGFSPLHLAVSTGNSSIVTILLESGAVVNIETMDGETPLHSAVANGDVTIIKLLLQYGAFLNVVDSEGDTPLHWAVRESKKESVKILIENGVIVDAVNNDDETPLHLAFIYGETQIVDMLMMADASVDTQDLTGSSPLHEAASQWSTAYVTELLRRGARVGIRDQYGETPLFGAVQNHRDQAVVTVMLQYGSDPNVRNSIGQCPLDVALPEIRRSLTFVQNKRDRIVYERKENWFYQSKPSSSSLGMGMGDNRFLFNEEMSKKMESLMGSPFLFAAPTTPFS